MFKISSSTLLGVALSALSTSLPAATLIDTGSPVLTSNGAVAVGQTQWMGISFSLSNSYRISDIQSYFYSSSTSFGTLTLSLYAANDGLPGNELYSQEFEIPNPLTSYKGWFGVSGVDWLVSPGDYWVTYEARNSQTYMGSLEFPAPTLLTAAVKNEYYTDWTVLSEHGFGIVVSGDLVSSVPEPSGIYQFSAGLVVLVGLAARRNRIKFRIER